MNRLLPAKLYRGKLNFGCVWWHFILLKEPVQKGVERHLAGAKDQDDERGDEKCVRVGVVELVGIGEDGAQRFFIGGDGGQEHVNRKRQDSAQRQERGRHEKVPPQNQNGTEQREY